MSRSYTSNELFYALPLEVWDQIMAYVGYHGTIKWLSAVCPAPRERGRQGRRTAWHQYRFTFHRDQARGWMRTEGLESDFMNLSLASHLPEINIREAHLNSSGSVTGHNIHFLDPLIIVREWPRADDGIVGRRAAVIREAILMRVLHDMSSLVILHLEVGCGAEAYLQRLLDACCNVTQLRLHMLPMTHLRIPANVQELTVETHVGVLSIPHTLRRCPGAVLRGMGAVCEIYDAANPSRTSRCTTREEAEQWTMPFLSSHFLVEEIICLTLFPWMPHLPSIVTSDEIVRKNKINLTSIGRLGVRWNPVPLIPHEHLHIYLDSENCDTFEQMSHDPHFRGRSITINDLRWDDVEMRREMVATCRRSYTAVILE
jgi:hypothetical protein